MDRKLDRLFRRFQARGDAAALGEVFDAAAPELSRVALFLCRDHASAEDALQATFQTVIEKRASYDRASHVMPWMLGILANHARKGRERARRSPDPERLEVREVTDPAVEAAGKEFRHLVDRGVSQLPEGYANAVRPYLEYGKSPAEIARALGISANAARVRLHRGLKLLRQALPAGAALGTAAGASGQGIDLARLRGSLIARASELSPVATATSLSTTGILGAFAMNQWTTLAATVALASGATFWITSRVHRQEIRELTDRYMQAQEQANHALAELQDAQHSTPLELPIDGARSAVATDTSDRRANETPRENPADAPVRTPSDEWLERIEQAPDWRSALRIAYEIEQLAPDEARDVMVSIFQRISNPQYRRQVLKPFVFDGGHVHALPILNEAATDTSDEVRKAAFLYLKVYAFGDLSTPPEAYAEWYAQYGELPVADVLRGNVRALVERLGRLSPAEAAELMGEIGRFDPRTARAAGLDLSELLHEAGLVDLVRNWVAQNGDSALQAGALKWLGNLDVDESILRDTVLPILQTRDLHDLEVQYAAWDALGREGATWAVEPILDEMQRIGSGHDGRFFGAAGALGKIGDPSAIPTLIGMIVADDTYATVYGVGYFGLSKLTGVDYDEAHDGAWWVNWWNENREHLPPHVSNRTIPNISLPQ